MADAAPNPNNAADNVNPVVQLPPQPQQPIADFTEQVCREKQMKIAKATATTKSSGSDSTSTGKEKLRNVNGKRKNWTNANHKLYACVNQIGNAVVTIGTVLIL